jgi:predicted  nucleic acid-binding Zn-ribbon protein
MRKSSDANQKDYFALESGASSTSFGEYINEREMGNKNQIFKAIENLRNDFSDLRKEVSDLRNDFSDLRKEVSDLRNDFSDLRKEVSDLRIELKQEVSRLDIKISDTKTEHTKDISTLNVDINRQIAGLVKWVVGFGITILVTLISLFLTK